MEILLILVGGAASTIGGILLYHWTSLNKRVRQIEESYLIKQEVRQLIEDKIGGIHSDVKDIKADISKLFDIYVKLISVYDKSPG